MGNPKAGGYLASATLVLGVILMFVALGITIFMKISPYYAGMSYTFLASGVIVALWGIVMMCFLCKTQESPERKEEPSKSQSPSSYSPGSRG